MLWNKTWVQFRFFTLLNQLEKCLGNAKALTVLLMGEEESKRLEDISPNSVAAPP